MKSNKRFLGSILVFTMLLALLSGCGSKNDTPAEDTPFSYSDGIDEKGFWEGVTALDYVETANYTGLKIPSDIHQISEDTIQAEIDGMLSSYPSREQVTNRAVIDGDSVNIDYVGSVDGVEFENTLGQGTDVTIGVTNYIDGFLEQLIGRTPGETFNLEVTFPEDYHEESLKGKDAVFVTTVNYIEETSPAELTDDFVAANFSASYGWETVAKMKEEVSAELQKAAVQKYISEYLLNEVPVSSVPDKLTEYQDKAMVRYYQDLAEYYTVDFDAFLTDYLGASDINELIESSRDSNLENARYTLVTQAVAEAAGISVSEDDMTEYFTDYSQYEEHYGVPYLKQIVLRQKAIDYIADNAVLE